MFLIDILIGKDIRPVVHTLSRAESRENNFLLKRPYQFLPKI